MYIKSKIKQFKRYKPTVSITSFRSLTFFLFTNPLISKSGMTQILPAMRIALFYWEICIRFGNEKEWNKYLDNKYNC